MTAPNMNYNQNQNNAPNNGFDWLVLAYITLNGMATGQTITRAADMIKNGYDRQTTIAMLLWLLMFVYSAQRIYEINRDHRNRNNKDKTR